MMAMDRCGTRVKKSIFPKKLFFRSNIPLPVSYPTGQLIIPKLCVPHLTRPLSSSVNPLFLYIIHISALASNPLLFRPLLPSRGHFPSSHTTHNISTKNLPSHPPSSLLFSTELVCLCVLYVLYDVWLFAPTYACISKKLKLVLC